MNQCRSEEHIEKTESDSEKLVYQTNSIKFEQGESIEITKNSQHQHEKNPVRGLVQGRSEVLGDIHVTQPADSQYYSFQNATTRRRNIDGLLLFLNQVKTKRE